MINSVEDPTVANILSTDMLKSMTFLVTSANTLGISATGRISMMISPKTTLATSWARLLS